MSRPEFLEVLDQRRKDLAKKHEENLWSVSIRDEYTAAEANYAAYSVWLRSDRKTSAPVNEPEGITE